MARTGATTYKAEILEQLRKKLRELPEHTPEGLSKTEIVRSLAVEIDELQKRGYSMRAIAEIISSEGVPITTVTLKGYLGRLKPPSRRTKRKRRRDAVMDASTTSGGGQPEAGAENRRVGDAVPVVIPEDHGVGGANAFGAGVMADGNKNTLEAPPVTAGPAARGLNEARRVAGAEVDKRKSTFVPRDDSRDI
jgi:hypothetical protein